LPGWRVAVHRRTAEKVDALVADMAEQIGRIDAVIDCTAADMSFGGLKRWGTRPTRTSRANAQP
jgi:hypothetical protein